MNKSFWDRDNNGRFDIVDVFWLALQIIAYGGGAVLMLSTFSRSYHLLSSPEMNPGVFWWWPYLTAASPEVGLVIAWLAGEVGFRKGRMELVAIAALGFVVFSVVVGTMSLYDVALIAGQNISQAQAWAHWIASILPLITIGYCGLATMLLSYMARREKLRVEAGPTIGTSWQVQRPQPAYPRPEQQLPRQAYPNPIEDLQTEIAGAIAQPAIRRATHSQATQIAKRNSETIKSNGKSPAFPNPYEKEEEEDGPNFP